MALLSSVDQDGRTPLSCAEAEGQLAVAQLLLGWGGDRSNESALPLVAGECAQTLLDAVLLADVDRLRTAIASETDGSLDCRVPGDANGRTLLHFAAAAAAASPPSVGE
jgi:ankyrin repeat protein